MHIGQQSGIICRLGIKEWESGRVREEGSRERNAMTFGVAEDGPVGIAHGDGTIQDLCQGSAKGPNSAPFERQGHQPLVDRFGLPLLFVLLLERLIQLLEGRDPVRLFRAQPTGGDGYGRLVCQHQETRFFFLSEVMG